MVLHGSHLWQGAEGDTRAYIACGETANIHNLSCRRGNSAAEYAPLDVVDRGTGGEETCAQGWGAVHLNQGRAGIPSSSRAGSQCRAGALLPDIIQRPSGRLGWTWPDAAAHLGPCTLCNRTRRWVLRANTVGSLGQQCCKGSRWACLLYNRQTGLQRGCRVACGARRGSYCSRMAAVACAGVQIGIVPGSALVPHAKVGSAQALCWRLTCLAPGGAGARGAQLAYTRGAGGGKLKRARLACVARGLIVEAGGTPACRLSRGRRRCGEVTSQRWKAAAAVC